MEATGRCFHSLRKLVKDWILSRSPLPTTMAAPTLQHPSTLDLEAGELEEQQMNAQQPAEPLPVVVPEYHGNDPPSIHFNWGAMIIGFCLTSAVEIALQSLQLHVKLHLLVHLLSLAMLFAFASIFVSTFVYPTFPSIAGALVQVAKFFAFTTFLFAITVPFSIWLRLISWSVFGICLLAIFYALFTNGRVHHARG